MGQLKIRIVFIGFLVFFSYTIFGQALQHKPRQMFLSPEISIGTPLILNQNNYGYSELAYDITLGGQAGLMFGWDNYLKQTFKTGITVSKWGQSYSDILSQKRVEKKVSLYYLQIPAIYKHVFGRKRGYDHEVFNPYVFGGLRIGYLMTGSAEFYRENASGTLIEEDLVSFVTKEGWNINTEEIIALGNPDKDKQLFTSLDLNLEIGAGYQYFITRLISLFAEVHLVSSLLDVNAGEWRLRDNKGKYSGSYNMYGGIKLGANFYLYKNKR